MGEAASRVAKEVRERHPELQWRRIIGFRNVLIQLGIDPDTVGRP
jgi:uncharacterized protein with HEPN domain